MAFRRRPMGRRRFRRRWDMQTFRDCERSLPLDVETLWSCATPQIFADYLCGIGPSTSPQMKSGAARSITFGGGHLRFRYNASVQSHTNMPCRLAVKVITALVVLPLLENDLTPAYLPTLAVARSQLSVVPATESDTDENILYWHDEQLDLINVSCFGGPPDGNIDCAVGFCCGSGSGCDSALSLYGAFVTAALPFGRFAVDHVVKARRRIREREALFLVTQYVTNAAFDGADHPWEIRRNAYMRYAVR